MDETSGLPVAQLANAIATATGYALRDTALAMRPLRVRVFPAQVLGDVAWASLELSAGDGFRAFGAVFDLGSARTALLLGERGGKTALVGDSHPERTEEIGARAAEWLRGGGLERVWVSALDGACDGLPFLARRQVVLGSWWRASFFGQWDPRSESGASLELGGNEASGWSSFITLTQLERGVELSVGGGLVPRSRFEATTQGELASALALAEGAAREALFHRARYQTRSFPLALAGQRILAALREGGVATTSHRLTVREHFPYRHPDGAIEHHDESGQHFDAVLHEDEGGVSISMGRHAVRVKDDAALEAALPDLVEAAREQLRRLTPDKLMAERSYTARQAFRDVAVGERLIFVRREYFGRDDFSTHTFRRDDARALVLCELDQGDLEILARLDELLARVP